MASLAEIEKLTKALADAQNVLETNLQDLKDHVLAVQKDHIKKIDRATEIFSAKHEALFNALVKSADLFEDPKTVVFNGIKVGFQKGKEKIVFDDESMTIKLIKKHLKDQIEALIVTSEKPFKPAISRLTASELKKIGASLEGGSDEPVIRVMDSEVEKAIDKLVAAYLKDAGSEG